MNIKDVALTIDSLRDDTKAGEPINVIDPIIVERMANYLSANIDHFMECYEDVDDDEDLYDIYLTKG